MTKMKVLASVLLALMVLFAQVGSAAAAPQTQDGTITVTGTVTAIGEPQTDANGVITVPVTVQDANGVETIVLVSEADAANLTVGQKDVTVTGTAGDAVPPEEEDVHPISQLLADFFFPDDPTMASMIDSWHNGEFTVIDEDGNEQPVDQVFGFGVIAQALWMSQTLNLNSEGADADIAALILQAKKTGDYSAFTLPGGESPTNWGQFKKALKGNNKHNLGVIVSGHANNDEDSLKGNDHRNNKDNKKPKKNNGKGNPHNP